MSTCSLENGLGVLYNCIVQIGARGIGTNWTKRVLKCDIFGEQLASVQDTEEEIKSLWTGMEEWREAYINLVEEKRNLAEEMQNAMREMKDQIDKQASINEQLEAHIKTMEEEEGIIYRGKSMSEVHDKKSTLNAFMGRAETALWFSKSFGLQLQGLKVKEVETWKKYNLEVEGQENNSLSDEDMNRIEQILFLLDKFCVSDEFYHELTMYEGELPRSYLIKQFRNNLNNICHVTPTPGQHEGAQISFESLLVEQIKAMKENSDFNPEKDALKIKISGDGARMTRGTWQETYIECLYGQSWNSFVVLQVIWSSTSGP